MTRTEFLKEATLNVVHKKARIAMPADWSVKDLPESLQERRARAVRLLLEKMPVYIGERELIVGSRTIYGHRNEETDKSDMSIFIMPEYINDEDRAFYGGGEMCTAGHYTADYGRILRMGIGGSLEQCRLRREGETDQEKIDFLNAVIIAYEGLSNLIGRYEAYAYELAEKENDAARRAELETIGKVCGKIRRLAPENFQEAVQLLWFSHLSLIIESYQFFSYGRLDQILAPFHREANSKAEQELIDCLVIKMYDMGDVVDGYFGTFSGQHTLTLGGVTPGGEDAVNDVTFMFLDAVQRVGFPEPMVEIRLNSKNPPAFLKKAARISISGINTVAYYNDDQFIRSMVAAGMPQNEANNYAFDLCQDICIAGRDALYCSANISLAHCLLHAMKNGGTACQTFDEFLTHFKTFMARVIHDNLEGYNAWETCVFEYNKGNKDYYLDKVKAGQMPLNQCCNSLTCPTPLASALFDGCLETATDLTRRGLVMKDKGVIIGNLVVAINSLAAIHKLVYDEKKYTMQEIIDACDKNYEGLEPMRQELWNAPKWANDDDYVDLPAKDLIEFCCREVLKHKTASGAIHFAGIHQPHPVGDGWNTPATPEGRKNRQPVTVTLSPENGTMLNGPTAALNSASKIDPMVYQWNNSVMLEFFATLFNQENGVELFSQMLTTYFANHGAQLQPNIVNVETLRAAQETPEKYKNLVVRLWGVSAQFINLPREVQEEFIARFETV